MSITEMDSDVRSYLAAIDATAIYICTLNGLPFSIGISRNLGSTLANLHQHHHPGLEFEWAAWTMNHDGAQQITKIPRLMVCQHPDGVTVARTLPQVIFAIECAAARLNVTLTNHDLVLERAHDLSGHINDVMDQLRANGGLRGINQDYKRYRLERQRQGETAWPYWAIMDRIKRVLIRSLAQNQRSQVAPDMLLAQIRKELPWLNTKS